MEAQNHKVTLPMIAQKPQGKTSYNSADITRILVLCKRKNHKVTLPMIAKK